MLSCVPLFFCLPYCLRSLFNQATPFFEVSHCSKSLQVLQIIQQHLFFGAAVPLHTVILLIKEAKNDHVEYWTARRCS